MNSGSWFTAVQNWQYPNPILATFWLSEDAIHLQEYFEKTKEKKKETSSAAAVLGIIKHTAAWLPQKPMDAQA